MAKKSFMPADDGGKRTFLNTFAAELPLHSAAVGVTAAEVTQTTADAAFFGYLVDSRNAYDAKTQEWTAYKNTARDGGTLGTLPAAPVLTTPTPAVVPSGIFVRISSLAARIKKHPAYTDAIGQDLGIVGADQTIDPTTMKPVLDLSLQAGHPNVGWTKSGMDSIEIWADRGTGTFVFMTIDTSPNSLDTFALPAPGASAVWKYKAIYRLNDEQVGSWSDVATIGVMG